MLNAFKLPQSSNRDNRGYKFTGLKLTKKATHHVPFPRTPPPPEIGDNIPPVNTRAVIECKCKEGTTDSTTRSSSQWVISTKEPIYYSWDYNVSIYIDCLLSTTMLWLMASFSAQFYRCWVPPSAFLSSSVSLLRLHFNEGNSLQRTDLFSDWDINRHGTEV